MKKKETDHTGEYHDRKKKPVDILDQDKGTTTRNPLHGDLSDKPEKENKAVRDSEAGKKSKH
ncbi:hypothetical protein SAMN05660461_4166 [Chitinophaga ginsengisegetis]|uniref:Uncharacterized protein n=1 Tax=Chitinophaga ginsengisegetis TaxID=393003 RepID=A0A1T5P612_9BACT|nr:hypothetical protein [Chitinophaga ginsengisegetis]SKD08214.1 hypothetical protein SAMN05660461_4166 [Chitinophaga ginsengisegetis]